MKMTTKSIIAWALYGMLGIANAEQNATAADDPYPAVYAKRLCEVVRAAQIDFEGRMLTTTASVGVAAYPEDGPNRNAVFKKSDAALYAAKAAGKDGVVCYKVGMDQTSVA